MIYIFSVLMVLSFVTESASAYVVKLHGGGISDDMYLLMQLCIPLSLISFLVYYITRNKYKTFAGIMKVIAGILFIIGMMLVFSEMY